MKGRDLLNFLQTYPDMLDKEIKVAEIPLKLDPRNLLLKQKKPYKTFCITWDRLHGFDHPGEKNLKQMAFNYYPET
jgi:hypothetical protein